MVVPTEYPNVNAPIPQPIGFVDKNSTAKTAATLTVRSAIPRSLGSISKHFSYNYQNNYKKHRNKSYTQKKINK
jgi:hypothetical protein